jgi:hypothetical protein
MTHYILERLIYKRKRPVNAGLRVDYDSLHSAGVRVRRADGPANAWLVDGNWIWTDADSFTSQDRLISHAEFTRRVSSGYRVNMRKEG